MDASTIVNVLEEGAKLREIKRQGWVNHHVPNSESVADHSFGVALLAVLVPSPANVDKEHLLRMAIVHDLLEAKIGDIVHEWGSNKDLKAKEEKRILEAQALKSFPDPTIKALMEEFEKQESAAARWLRELDKLDMAVQALTYEKKGNCDTLQLFWDNIQLNVHSLPCVQILDEIQNRRTKNPS